MSSYYQDSSNTKDNGLNLYEPGASSVVKNDIHYSNKINHENVLNRPRSLLWRLFHGTNYLIASLCFVGASAMFLDRPKQAGPSTVAAGGWLYTIGSFLFLLADLVDWWYSRLGCCCYSKYKELYEKQNGDLFRFEKGTVLGCLMRTEVGLNFFLSACGSMLYLAGSILFIPGLEDYVVTGFCLIISASSVVVVAQSWKIYRAACTNNVNRKDHRFRFLNLFNDISCLLMDVFSGLGGAFFLIGTIYFLPQYYIDSPFGNDRPAGLCLCGSAFFTLSGLVIQYRHYCLAMVHQKDSYVV